MAFTFVAVLLWSTLAYLTRLVPQVPPFLMTAIGFLIGSAPVVLLKPRQAFASWKHLALGVLGLFGFHSLLFASFRLAPPLEANLVMYTWPVMMILLSSVVLKGYRLRKNHLVGGAIALSGIALIATSGNGAAEGVGGATGSDPFLGYLVAAGAGLSWSIYSLVLRRLPPVSSWVMAGSCFLTALFSLVLHFVIEPPVQISAADWGVLLFVGAGPMGIAYFFWDIGLKRADPRVVASIAFLTPVLSTLFLNVLGGAPMTVVTSVALLCILVGAVIGSLEIFKPRA